MIEPYSQIVRREVKEAEQGLANAKAVLTRLESCCGHDWTPTKYDPIYHEAYTIPGDPPGTMGIDWRGPVYVAAETEDRWIRDCRKCGKHEETKRATEKQIVQKTPQF